MTWTGRCARAAWSSSKTPEGVTHRDYVTHAWTENPVKEVLVKMAATPELTRVAAGASSSASR